MAETDDRTEAATPRRLQKARDEGKFAVSRELTMLCGLAAGISALDLEMHEAMRWAPLWLGLQMQTAGTTPTLTSARAAFGWVMVAVLPVALTGMAASLIAGGLQTGMALHFPALLPDVGRISPLAGIKRLFGVETLLTALRAMVKLTVLLVIFWFTLRDAGPALMLASVRTPLALLHQGTSLIATLIVRLLMLQFVLTIADVLIVRLRFARSMRMSRSEMRDEAKETEGSPEARQRLRQMARARARRRMMAAVPKATVIITNPEHYAIALSYHRGENSAPRVVAKGADEMAARIREVAREFHVPIIANPPLARALYRVEIDTEIPAEHFKAVAEIIAYIWRLASRVGVR